MRKDTASGLALVVEVGESESLSRTLPLVEVHAVLQLFQVLEEMRLYVVLAHGGPHHHLLLLLLYVVLHLLVLARLSLELHVRSVAVVHSS